MVTIGPDPPRPAEHAVDGAGQANGKASRAARKGALVRGFDQEMHVVALHGEMKDAEPLARSASDSASHLRKHGLLAQTREPPHRPQGDVHRMTL